MHAGAFINLLLVEGHAEEALERGQKMLPHAIDVLTPSTDGVRDAWPATLQAALQSGRLDEARGVLDLLASHPAGHIPPYLEAQLARGRALTNAAAGEHESVESDLQLAIERFRSLGYPYWLAVAQTDLAEWLIGQRRGEEAEGTIEEATAALTALGAKPALDRAEGLQRVSRVTAET